MTETTVDIMASAIMMPKSYEIYPVSSSSPLNGIKGCMGAVFKYDINFFALNDEPLKIGNTGLILDGNCGRLRSLSWIVKDQEAYTDKERLKMELCKLARPFFFVYLDILHISRNTYRNPYESTIDRRIEPNSISFGYLDYDEKTTPKVRLGGVDVELGKKTGRVLRLSWQEKINSSDSVAASQKILEAAYPFYTAYQLLTREEN